MTIFDYSKCQQCNHMRKHHNKETLSKIFPEDIGNIIQSFNCCDSCNRLINLEDDYDFYPEEKYKLTTFEKQLFILKERDNIDVYFAGDDRETKKQKLVNMFMNSDNPYKKVIISFIKNRRIRFFDKLDSVLDFLHNKEIMKHVTRRENISILHYDYYKKSYPDKLLFKNIMYEFLVNFIGKDIDYLNLDELQKHLSEIFDREQD